VDLLIKYYEKILFGVSLLVLLTGAVFFLNRANSDTLVSPIGPNDVLGKVKINPEDPQYKPVDLVVPKVPELKMVDANGNGMLSPAPYIKCLNAKCAMCIEFERDACPFCGTTQREVPPTKDPNDLDGDGIPNAIEIANGLDPNNPSDALMDPRNTGFTNLERLVKYKQYANPKDLDKTPPLAFLLRVTKAVPAYFPFVLKKTYKDVDGQKEVYSAKILAFPTAGGAAAKAIRNVDDKHPLVYRDNRDPAKRLEKNMTLLIGDRLQQKLGKDYKGPDLVVKNIEEGKDVEIDSQDSKGVAIKKVVQIYKMEMVDEATGKTYVFTSDEVVDCGDRQVTFVYLIDRSPSQAMRILGVDQATMRGGVDGSAYPGPASMGGPGPASMGGPGPASMGGPGPASMGGSMMPMGGMTPGTGKTNPIYTVITGDSKKITLRSPRQMMAGGIGAASMMGAGAMPAAGGMMGTGGASAETRQVMEDYLCISYDESKEMAVVSPVNDAKVLFPVPKFEVATDLFEVTTGGMGGMMPISGGDQATPGGNMQPTPQTPGRRPGGMGTGGGGKKNRFK
jgi:hypothetical protein